jgi:WD40 repeat protein
MWDLASRHSLGALEGARGTVWSIDISPDGGRLAAAGEDATIRIWDLVKREPARQLRGHDKNVWEVRFSPDGLTLASGSFDNTLHVWDVASGRAVRSVSGHSEAIVRVAYSPDGRLIEGDIGEGRSCYPVSNPMSFSKPCLASVRTSHRPPSRRRGRPPADARANSAISAKSLLGHSRIVLPQLRVSPFPQSTLRPLPTWCGSERASGSTAGVRSDEDAQRRTDGEGVWCGRSASK